MLINHVKEFFRENHIVDVVNNSPIAACVTPHPLLEISKCHKLLLCLSKQFLELLHRHECVYILRTNFTFVNNSLFTWRLLHVHSIWKILNFVLLLLLDARVGLFLFFVVVLTHDVQCALHMVVLGSEIGGSGQHEPFKLSVTVLRFSVKIVDSDDSRLGILLNQLDVLSVAVHCGSFQSLCFAHLLDFVSLITLRHGSRSFFRHKAACEEWLCEVRFVQVVLSLECCFLSVTPPCTRLDAFPPAGQADAFGIIFEDEMSIQHRGGWEYVNLV